MSSKKQNKHKNNKRIRAQARSDATQVSKNTHSATQTVVKNSDMSIDIARFTYKDSFIVIGIGLVCLFVIPWFCSVVGVDYRLPTVLLTSVSTGFSTVYVLYKNAHKPYFTPAFFLVGCLLSLFISIILSLFIFRGIVI